MCTPEGFSLLHTATSRPSRERPNSAASLAAAQASFASSFSPFLLHAAPDITFPFFSPLSLCLRFNHHHHHTTCVVPLFPEDSRPSLRQNDGGSALDQDNEDATSAPPTETETVPPGNEPEVTGGVTVRKIFTTLDICFYTNCHCPRLISSARSGRCRSVPWRRRR